MSISDFNKSELQTINNCLNQRYKMIPELQLADSELRLDQETSELTLCPTAVWHESGVTFAVFKSDESEYRCLFYLNPSHQFGTGTDKYNDLGKCVLTLLQVQADYERGNHEKWQNLAEFQS